MEEFNHWDEVFADLDKKVNQVTRKAGFDAERIAKQRSRVDKGDMRAEWYVRTEDSSDRQELMGSDLFPEVEPTPHNEVWLIGGSKHTIYNEYGTRYMSAQPMATPAIEEVRAPYLKALAEIVGA